MSNFLTVHAITNNRPKGRKPRQPLVHILASGDDMHDVQSISFTPDDAWAIASAITTAAQAATKGLRRKPVILELKSQDTL